MADIKHVGRVRASGRKCLVVFRTLPGDAFNCLVVLTENLGPGYHDALINLVESNAGQAAFEFADVLNRNIFSDGTNMLQSLHVQGLLTKFPTDQIEITPNSSSSIVLSDLNQLIAEQQGCSVQDLSIREEVVSKKEIAEVKDISPIDSQNTEPVIDQVESNLLKQAAPLSDADLARQYRADADRLSKEAAELRRKAEELVPTKRKAPARGKSTASA